MAGLPHFASSSRWRYSFKAGFEPATSIKEGLTSILRLGVCAKTVGNGVQEL